MNLQRREEIRVIAECPNDRHWAQEMRRAVAELLAHIDTLEQTAAERVIARGAVIAPHTFGEIVNQVRDIAAKYAGTEQLRERIAYALAPHFERDAGPTPDYTGEGSAWVPPVEAPAVVVPLGDTFTLDLDEFGKSLACITINSKNRGVGYQLCGTMGDGHFSRRTFDITPYLGHCLNLIGIRAVPDGRVLGEGMVAVTWIPVDEALPENGQTVGFVTECANDKWYHGRVLGGRYMAGEFGGFSVPGLMVQASHWFAFPPLPDVLRANHGGPAT